MRSYRAQGSSEYLVLLAVVLIVTLVAVALLGGFSGFGSGARDSENAQYWSATRPFAISGYTQQGDTMTLFLKNQEVDRYTITNLSVGNSSNDTGIVFNGGQSKNMEIHGLRTCDALTYDSFEYNVSIVYDTPYITTRFQGAKTISGICVP